MIYAIILIILGLIAILFNKKDITKRAATVKAWVAPLFIVWGLVGIAILSTARLGVMQQNPIYWYLLILGSLVEILIGVLFIYRNANLKKDFLPNKKLYLSEYVLGTIAILIGIATIVSK